MITYSKYTEVITSVSELKKIVRDYIGADCWGCYTQKKKKWHWATDEVNDKCVYFDLIELENINGKDSEEEEKEEKRQEKVREKLYSDHDNEVMDEVVTKIDNGEILTIVMFYDQNYGDVSFFKVGENYVWTCIKQD